MGVLWGKSPENGRPSGKNSRTAAYICQRRNRCSWKVCTSAVKHTNLNTRNNTPRMSEATIPGGNSHITAPPDAHQNEWRLLQGYLYYRLLLSLSLLAALFFSDNKQSEWLSDDQQLYFATAATYLVLTVLSLLTARLRTGRLSIQVFIIIVTDILAIALLEYANGQSNSNLTILLVVTVAAGSILVEGKLANFFAAIATLGVLYREIYTMVVRGAFSQQEIGRAH